jgi:cell division protein FtsB
LARTGEAAAKEARSTGVWVAAVVYQWRRRVATVLAIALAVFLAYHVMFGANGLTVYEQKRNEDHALKQRILELQQENARLKDHIQNLKSDPDTIEHEARTILHYTRPGEVIYKLNAPSASSGGN